MRATCACCERPYDDQWVIYCPVNRDLFEQLRGDGLTTNYPVTMRIGDDGVIVITEHHYPDHIDGSGRASSI